MYVIWRDKENNLHRLLCMTKEIAKETFDQIKDFKVKEISNNEYGYACGLYDTSKMKKNNNLLLINSQF